MHDIVGEIPERNCNCVTQLNFQWMKNISYPYTIPLGE